MRTLSLAVSAGALAGLASTQTPERFQYQFNEVRGAAVANTASTAVAPAAGTVNSATWFSDPGRPAYQGNEPGFGCLGYRGTGGNWVHTGWRISQTGSFSVMFWMRRDPLSVSTNPFGYAFGDVTFRAFAAGAAGSGITFRGSPIGNVDSVFPVVNTPGVWQHVALVVDDAAGRALWYDNGTPSTNVVAFAPNTFNYVAATRFMAVAAQGDSGLSPFGAHYDMDDFRYFTRALLQTEIQAIMGGEAPSAGPFGTACAGPGGPPAVAGSGLPYLGNAAFSVDLSSAEAGRACVLVFGIRPATFGTLDLSGFLGAGCTLQTDPLLLFATATSGAGTASLTLPIPADSSLVGAHAYTQWLIVGSQGAVTPVLDVNIQS